MSPAVTSGSARPLSADAIEASHALASRERQDAAAKKRGAKGKVSLGGSAALQSEETIVFARRAEYAKSEEVRLAARPAAVPLGKGLKLTGTYEEVKADGHTKVVPYEDATPERINQARIGQEVTVVAGVRHFADPFSVLRTKGLLDKEPSVNEALYQAGQDYRRRHEMADLGGVKAMNLMKDIVDGGSGEAGCPISDRAMDARRKLREGAAAVGPRLLPYLTGLLVEDRTVESMSGMVQDSKSDRLRYAIAMERVREALHRLCDAWGISPNNKPLAIQSVTDESGVRNFERRAKIKG